MRENKLNPVSKSSKNCEWLLDLPLNHVSLLA